MSVKMERDGGMLTVYVEGKLNAVTSPQLEAEL